MGNALKPTGLVRIPPIPKRGGDVLAWSKRVRTCLQDLRQLNVNPPASRRVPAKPPFWVRVFFDSSAGAMKFAVSPGWVRGWNIRESDTLVEKMPTLGGTALDADPAPSATLSVPCKIYVRVQTDGKGVISGTPTIEQEPTSTPPTNTHHTPADPVSSAQTGDYYFIIAEISSGSNPSVTKRYVGNLLIPNQLVELSNVGGGAKVYRDYTPGTDAHAFRSLVERATNPAIQVDEEANEIRIHGTGIDATFQATDECGNAKVYTVTDGLISAIADP